MFVHSAIVLLLVKLSVGAHDTTCEEDQKHFADICFTPNPAQNFDLSWYLKTQPEDGYFVPIGNDISRLHFAELLQGKLLTLQDDFNGTCFRVKSVFGGEDLTANVTGFKTLHGIWNCKLSKDHVGVFLCDGTVDGPSKFHENFHFYPIYSDYKNFVIGALCYPNGQAGWSIHSATPTLTDEEKKIINEKVNELGFVYDDYVDMYNEFC